MTSPYVNSNKVKRYPLPKSNLKYSKSKCTLNECNKLLQNGSDRVKKSVLTLPTGINKCERVSNINEFDDMTLNIKYNKIKYVSKEIIEKDDTNNKNNLNKFKVMKNNDKKKGNNVIERKKLLNKDLNCSDIWSLIKRINPYKCNTTPAISKESLISDGQCKKTRDKCLE